MARQIHEASHLPFFEIFVNTPLEECEKRDVKGLYKKARAGIIKGFTGIDQAYEEPDAPELHLKTVNRTIKETVLEVIELLEKNGIIPKAVNDNIVDLYVPPTELRNKRLEAESLPSVEVKLHHHYIDS